MNVATTQINFNINILTILTILTLKKIKSKHKLKPGLF